jgi:hypothetical protein
MVPVPIHTVEYPFVPRRYHTVNSFVKSFSGDEGCYEFKIHKFNTRIHFHLSSSHSLVKVQVHQYYSSNKSPFAISPTMSSDKEIEQKIGLSRKDHENRNQLNEHPNELPNGKLKSSAEDFTIW